MGCPTVWSHYTTVSASRYLPILRRASILSGLIYGVGVYLVMNLVVLPLSAAGRPSFAWPILLNGLLIHMLGVGLPSSLFARAMRRTPPSRLTRTSSAGFEYRDAGA